MRRRAHILVLCLACLLLAPLAPASPALAGDPKPIGSCPLPDPATSVVVAGDYAFVAAGNLQVVDVSDPAAPSISGSCALPPDWAGGVDVALAGDLVYLVAWGGGLQIIDVSDPTAPVEAGSCLLPNGGAQGVAVSGDFAYVAAGGLHLVDVSDPAAPVVVGSCALPGQPWAVAVAGDFAYVADMYDGLQVVDVSDPAAPAAVGSYARFYATDIAVVGDHAYLADYASGLDVLDIANPSGPELAGSLPVNAYGITAVGTLVYLAAGAGGLQVVDVSDPGAPVAIGSCPLPDTSTGVAVADKHAYLANGWSGLYVVDLDPAQVSGLTPDHGAVGATVVIAGTSLGSAGTVRFGEIEAATTAWTDTSITCTVPEGLSTGATSVTVTPAAGATSDGLAFTVEGAQLSVLAPDHGVPGATVVISGSQLGTSGTVRFGGTAAAMTEWSETSITCTVPDGLEQGSVGVTVTPTGGATSNVLGFTVDSTAVTLIAAAKPAVVGYKRTVTVTGVLRDSLGGPLPGRTLVLQRSLDGNTWTDFKAAVSGAAGEVSASTTIVRKTYFRWSFAGDGTYLPAVSPQCSAISRASLTPPAVPSTVRHGVKYVASGYLRPQHTGGRAPLTISFYRYSGGRWRSMGGLTESRWRNVSGATKYTIWLKIPANLAGKWRVRTVHKDADHAKTTSAWRTFTVK